MFSQNVTHCNKYIVHIHARKLENGSWTDWKDLVVDMEKVKHLVEIRRENPDEGGFRLAIKQGPTYNYTNIMTDRPGRDMLMRAWNDYQQSQVQTARPQKEPPGGYTIRNGAGCPMHIFCFANIKTLAFHDLKEKPDMLAITLKDEVGHVGAYTYPKEEVLALREAWEAWKAWKTFEPEEPADSYSCKFYGQEKSTSFDIPKIIQLRVDSCPGHIHAKVVFLIRAGEGFSSCILGKEDAAELEKRWKAWWEWNVSQTVEDVMSLTEDQLAEEAEESVRYVTVSGGLPVDSEPSPTIEVLPCGYLVKVECKFRLAEKKLPWVYLDLRSVTLESISPKHEEWTIFRYREYGEAACIYLRPHDADRLEMLYLNWRHRAAVVAAPPERFASFSQHGNQEIFDLSDISHITLVKSFGPMTGEQSDERNLRIRYKTTGDIDGFGPMLAEEALAFVKKWQAYESSHGR